MNARYSNFIAANGANFRGTQTAFSATLKQHWVSYDAVQWLGDIQVYTWLGNAVAWYYINRGYCEALELA